MHKRSILALTAASLLAAAPALAQVSATAATDLNFRAGPGGNQQILGVIPAGGEVTVLGCLEASSWCQVDVGGQQGWAFGDYLNATVEEQQVVVIENREPLAIETVTFADASVAEAVDDSGDAAVGAGAGAALAAALIGGPAAIAAGAVLGAAASGGDVEPALTYVQENPVEPIYLDGEVIVGAGIPQEVEIIGVPETQYGYLNVNGLPVLVDNESRQIVQIIRSE